MGSRSPSNQIDDQARTAVEKVLAEGGLATEVVHKDYGEDLLVQVSIDDEVQPARCWIQVKGTGDSSKKARKDGSFAVPVATRHLFRWARSADPVLLVLWDVTQDRGWWTTPRSQIDQYALYMRGKATQTLRIPQSQELDLETAKSLAWQITLEHFTNQIVQAKTSQIVASEIAEIMENPAAGDDVPDPQGARVLVFDVLRLLGVIVDSGISEEALTMVRNGVANLEKDKAPEEEESDLLASAAMLTLLGMADSRAGMGLPHTLLAELFGGFMAILDDVDLER